MKKLSPIAIALITIAGSLVLKKVKKAGWLDVSKITDVLTDSVKEYLRRQL